MGPTQEPVRLHLRLLPANSAKKRVASRDAAGLCRLGSNSSEHLKGHHLKLVREELMLVRNSRPPAGIKKSPFPNAGSQAKAMSDMS